MSVRNNEERTGAAPDESPPTPVVANKSTNNELSFVTPTEFVELPSRGEFYPEGHPLYGQETIEIRHMTAKEEDILTSRALLKKGLAIDRMLSSVIVDNSINIDDMLIGDKNAVLIATRVTGYGEHYMSNIGCIACGETYENEFSLSDFGTIGYDDSMEDVERTSASTFKILLPLSNVYVEVRILNGKDEKFLTKSAEQKKKKGLPEALLTDTFRRFIVSVNDVTDKNTINQFVNSMPARDSRFLRKTYGEITPNVDLTQGVECTECGYEEEVEIPLSAEFFWPKR